MNDTCSCFNFMCPVRHSNLDELLCQPCDEEDEGFEQVSDAPIVAHVDSDEKLPDSDIMDIEGDVVVQAAQPLPQPKVPTAAQIAAHNITHLPYRSWCPHCVAARRPNSQHFRASSQSVRADPLLVADYCFVRDNVDSECVTVLVASI